MLVGTESAGTALDPSRAPAPASRAFLLKALVLVLLTVAAYIPSLPGEFIWDDDNYVVDNPLLEDTEGLVQMWTPRVTPQYYPAVFSLFWVQYQLWGLEPLGFHAVNLGLHVLSALLVWRLARRLGLRSAWVLGAAFALHPLHVESVAWVTELKNVLSGTFYLGAALAYLSFDASTPGGSAGKRGAWYVLALALFVVALLSKTVTFSLPAALLLVLVHLTPGQRLGPVFSPRRLAPLLPFLAVGIWLALHTAEVESEHVGASGEPFDFSLAERSLIASRALLFYPAKLLVPWPTLFSYPRWTIDAGDPAAYWSVALVLALALAGVWAWRRGGRSGVLAACFYAGSIAPALGLLSFYPMLFSFVADHFCYLSSLGILALITGLLARAGPAAVPLQAVWLLGLGGLTAVQAHNFRSAESLYRHTLEHNPDSWLMQSTLSGLLLNRALDYQTGTEPRRADPLVDEATQRLTRAALLYDDHHQVHFNLASALFLSGDFERALRHAERSVEIQPQTPKCHWQVGRIQLKLGMASVAVESLREAERLLPSTFYATEVGRALVAAGRTDEGLGALREVRAAASSEERGRVTLELARGLASAPELTRDQRLEALELLQAIDVETPGGLMPETLPLRAHAQARLGRFKAAVRNLESYIQLSRETGRLEDIDGLGARLEAYRRGELPAE